MRHPTAVCIWTLAASNAALAHASIRGQKYTSNERLLTDIDLISQYWGASKTLRR